MASPPTKTLTTLSGRYKLSKALSTPSSITSILAIQGTSSFLRYLISTATILLKVTQPAENEYRITQSAISASVPGTTERYVLDNEWRENRDPFFGMVRGRSRWIGREEVGREYPELGGEWEGSGDLVFAEGGKADGTWSAERIWGFEVIDGKRMYLQRVKVWNKKGETTVVLMVYEFTGEA